MNYPCSKFSRSLANNKSRKLNHTQIFACFMDTFLRDQNFRLHFCRSLKSGLRSSPAHVTNMKFSIFEALTDKAINSNISLKFAV